MAIHRTFILGSLTLKCRSVVPKHPKRIVHHPIPERDGDRLQYTGFNSKMWNINGWLDGTNKDANRTTLNTYYDNDLAITFNDGSTNFTVRIEELEIIEPAGGMPIWNYTMVLVEDNV